RELDLVTQTREDVLQVAPRLGVVEDLVRGGDRNSQLGRARPQPRFLPRFFQPTMTCSEGIQPIAECFLESVPDEEGVRLLDQQGTLPTPQRQQPRLMLVDLTP